MSATWGRDWIKLYIHPSAEWDLLPALVRGIGNVILQHTDRSTGTIVLGKDWFPAFCRFLKVHPRERRQVREIVDVLLADGFITISDEGVLTVRNYLRAQSAVAPVTERVRATRARQAGQQIDAPGVPLPAPSVHEPSSGRAPAEREPSSGGARAVHEQSAGTDATPRKDTAQVVTETPFLEENKKRLEEKKTHCPSPSAVGTASVPEGQPTEKVDPPKLELSAPPPAKPKAAKRSEDPPPFSWRSGLEVIATACSRFALPGDREVTKEQAIALAKQVRTFPKLEDWKLAGEFLGANGEGWRSSLNVSYVASSSFAATIAAARAWEKRGRPAMDRKGNEQDPTKGPATGWFHRRMTDAEFDSLVEVVPVGGGHGRPATTR